MVKDIHINSSIRAPTVRLIGSDGIQIGIVGISEALAKASEQGLDLVEISPDAVPPVCKIMNYGKYLYEQEKKTRIAKKKQHIMKSKEVRFRPKIDEHDYQVKMHQVHDFLKAHHRVKVTIKFKGREVIHNEFGKQLLERLIADLKDTGVPDGVKRWEGKNMVLTFYPLKG